MNKLEIVRQKIDDTLRDQPDIVERRCGFVHLYGVSAMCSLLALKRGLDPQLGAVMGMLHDLATYKFGKSADHAEKGTIEAARILHHTGHFSPDEISIIQTAIAHHSDKTSVHGPYDELLKDADVLQHYLYNTAFSVSEVKQKRLNKILDELAIDNRQNVSTIQKA